MGVREKKGRDGGKEKRRFCKEWIIWGEWKGVTENVDGGRISIRMT
jgi:hypothetical protein